MSSFFLLIGSILIFVSACAIWKQSETLVKVQYSTIVNTLGLLCILIGTVLHFKTGSVLFQSTVIWVGILIVMPLGAHMMAIYSWSQEKLKKEEQKP